MRYATRSVLVLGLAAIVAGCGGTAPSASGATAATAATAAPDVTEGVSATPDVMSTPDPDEATAAAASAAFMAWASGMDTTFHAEQWAKTTPPSGDAVDVEYVVDVAGRDFRGTMSTGGNTAGFVALDGTVWVSTTPGTWEKTTSLGEDWIAQISTPWIYLGAPDGLVYVARDPNNPDNLRFANDGPFPFASSAMAAQGVEATVDTLDFVITPDGLPVSLVAHMTVPQDGQTAELLTSIEFSKVDEPVTIEKPE